MKKNICEYVGISKNMKTWINNKYGKCWGKIKQDTK